MKGKLIVILAALILPALSVAAVNTTDTETGRRNNAAEQQGSSQPAGQPKQQKKAIAEADITNRTENGYDLNFDENRSYTLRSEEVNGKTVFYRAYENIVYVNNPADIQYQTINIYIPEEYFENRKVGKYSVKTAPIFFPNSIGGYMPGAAGTVGTGRDGKPNASAVALSKGYVVAAPGARGRTLKDQDGKYTGKAPAAIVDLKAAVRYLKYNDSRMPGRADRIVSNGTSAGGALSALLGAAGNAKDYEPYLKELGAAKGSDDIFAVSAYCPITNLDHANEAYEWTFNGVNDYKKISVTMLDYNVQRTETAGQLTEAEIRRSDELKAMFPAYLNSLKLKDRKGKLLTLDKNGNGSFRSLIKKYYMDSADRALKEGKDLSKFKFLTIRNNKAVNLDLDAYIRYMGRMKTPGAFDNVDLSTGENNLFGNSDTDNRHFTEYAYRNTAVAGKMAEKNIIKMMNPMDYLGKSGIKTSQNWRIRHGAVDKDTALAIPVILAVKLQNLGKNVDFAAPWGVPHSGDYDLEEMFTWADSLMK